MLESLVSLVNFITATLSFGYYISYKAGYYLVVSINTLLKYFTVILDSIRSFSSVLGESLVIFLQDSFQIVQQILLWVTTTVEVISSGIATIFLKLSLFTSNVASLMSSICNGLENGVAAINASLGQLMALIKNLVVLFGSGVWFLITLVPFLLYYLCSLCIFFIYSIYQDICGICYSGVVNAKALIKGTVLFIFDVPFESVAGLVIAFSLVYIFNQFYVLITSYFKRQLRKGQVWIRQHWQHTEMFSQYFNTWPWPRRQPVPTLEARPPIREPIRNRQLLRARQPIQTRSPVLTRQRTRKLKEPIWEEKLCVICQERNKCVLLLPCKHLCLCSECTGELRFYNELCPICRTNIESTMKIFI